MTPSQAGGMGLLNRLRDLLSGPPGTGTGDEDHSDRGAGVVSRSELADAVGRRERPKPGNHGSHWGALLPDEDAIIEATVGAIEDGETIEGSPEDGAAVVGYLAGRGPVRPCVVTRAGAVATAYPELDGVAHSFRPAETTEWTSGVEAQHAGAVDGTDIRLFDTRYFATGPGPAAQTFELAGLAYDLEPADAETLVDERGREFSTAGKSAFVPFEDGDVDDFLFQTVVRAVDRAAVAGHTVYRMRVPLVQGPGDRELRIDLYAAAHVTGTYVPAPGDDVEGVLWLQGRSADPGVEPVDVRGIAES